MRRIIKKRCRDCGHTWDEEVDDPEVPPMPQEILDLYEKVPQEVRDKYERLKREFYGPE